MSRICAAIVAILASTGSAQNAAAQVPKNSVEISTSGTFRYVTSNGIPDHPIGQFPNRNNPNTMTPQSYRFRIPLKPETASTPIPLGRRLFGVAVNGIPFDPGTAEFWRGDPRSGWNYEALSGRINLGLDGNNGHVQPTGAYHYHGLPTGIVTGRTDASKMVLLGFAADGFPIYSNYGYSKPNDTKSPLRILRSSYRLKEGTRPGGPGGTYDGTFVQDYAYKPGTGDLDECNGRFGLTPEYPNGTYYYVVTDTYPFVPRLFRGVPDDSFLHRGFARGPFRPTNRSGRPPGPPPPPGHRPPPFPRP